MEAIFSSRYGLKEDLESACDECNGTGISKTAYPIMVIKDKKKSLKNGALFRNFCNKGHAFKFVRLYSLAKHYRFSFEEPFETLPEYAKDLIFYGILQDIIECPESRTGQYISNN